MASGIFHDLKNTVKAIEFELLKDAPDLEKIREIVADIEEVLSRTDSMTSNNKNLHK